MPQLKPGHICVICALAMVIAVPRLGAQSTADSIRQVVADAGLGTGDSSWRLVPSVLASGSEFLDRPSFEAPPGEKIVFEALGRIHAASDCSTPMSSDCYSRLVSLYSGGLVPSGLEPAELAAEWTMDLADQGAPTYLDSSRTHGTGRESQDGFVGEVLTAVARAWPLHAVLDVREVERFSPFPGRLARSVEGPVIEVTAGMLNRMSEAQLVLLLLHEGAPGHAIGIRNLMPRIWGPKFALEEAWAVVAEAAGAARISLWSPGVAHAFREQLSTLRIWTLVDLALATGTTDVTRAQLVLAEELNLSVSEAERLIVLMHAAPGKYGGIYPSVRALLRGDKGDFPLEGFEAPCEALRQAFGEDSIDCRPLTESHVPSTRMHRRPPRRGGSRRPAAGNG